MKRATWQEQSIMMMLEHCWTCWGRQKGGRRQELESLKGFWCQAARRSHDHPDNWAATEAESRGIEMHILQHQPGKICLALAFNVRLLLEWSLFLCWSITSSFVRRPMLCCKLQQTMTRIQRTMQLVLPALKDIRSAFLGTTFSSSCMANCFETEGRFRRSLWYDRHNCWSDSCGLKQNLHWACTGLVEAKVAFSISVCYI